MPLDVDSKLDGFLKIGDIPGASERDGHEEEIEVYGVELHHDGALRPEFPVEAWSCLDGHADAHEAV